MSPRAALAAVLCACLSTLSSAAPAQTAPTDATALQDASIHAWVSYRAVRARFGEAHESTVARAEEARSLALNLAHALARGEHVDVAVLVRTLEVELSDVRTRLGELGTRCGGPAVEVLAAEARRDALEEAIARLTSDGPFVPDRG